MTDPAPGRLVVVAWPPPGIEPSDRARAALAEAAVLVDDDADAAAVVTAVRGGSAVVLRTEGSSAPIVGAVVDAGLPVEVVPAAVAPVAALVASGLATDHVAVEPPLPPAGPARAQRLAALAVSRRTTALPMTGEGSAATLAAVAAACGPARAVAVAVGLGTPAEQVWRGTAGEAAVRRPDAPAGLEVVLVVGGDPEPEAGPDQDDDAVRAALRDARSRGLSPGRAAAEVAAALGRPRREVYALGATEDDG